MLNYLRTTFTDTDADDIRQEKFVEDSTAYHGKRAVIENQNYQVDRMWKQNYILVNIIAEGYDQKRFVEFLVKRKSKCYNLFTSLRLSLSHLRVDLLINDRWKFWLCFVLCRPLCSAQDTTPNVDYFTRDEIRSVVKDFKTKVAAGEADAVSNFS